MIFILLVDDLLLFSFNNILFRSLGISWDLHFDCNYYFSLLFYICYSLFGDSFDRVLIRMYEIHESIYLIYNIVYTLIINIEYIYLMFGNVYFKWLLFTSMELMINCFYFDLFVMINLLEVGFTYAELPKGEFINCLFIFDLLFIYRNRIRSIGFICLNSFMFNVKGYFISDLVVAIGTIDIVFGEIDR